MVKKFFPLIFFCFSSSAIAASNLTAGMVVSENKIASAVGAAILNAGGNAIDAAVATGYALAVVNPCCGNIGGGGFMVIRLGDGKTIFVNFREKAPARATPAMFMDKNGQVMIEKSLQGYSAVGVPGTVLAFETVLKKYGTLSRQVVMAPAIKLAEEGFIVSPYQAQQFANYKNEFSKQKNVAAIFLPNGKTYAAGDRLLQKNLANTLRQISDKGASVFYDGTIAQEIVHASEMQGGLLTLRDFNHYQIKIGKPISCHYRGYTLFSAAPPSAGGVILCEMLAILANFPLSKIAARSFANTAILLETMRYGLMDRNQKLGDPDFVKNPVSELLSKTYTHGISEKIKNASSAQFSPAKNFHETTDTTHFSVIDNKGNAVAVTFTLNGFFGAGVIAGNTGFFLNNEMNDFALSANTANKFGAIDGALNRIQGNKRPLSSMTPTVVLKNNELYMVLGSPGGPRIISTVLLTLTNVFDQGLTLQQAIDQPRFHYQVDNNLIDVEPFAFSYLTAKKLQWLHYKFSPPSTWGAVEGILIDQKTGKLYAGSDKRRPDGGAVLTSN